VIERISRQSYASFLSDRIFAPLEMHDTGYGTIPGDVVKGYVRSASSASEPEKWQSGRPLRLEIMGGFGGLYSTLDDVLVWIRALESNKILSAAYRKAMFADRGHNYGFGWRFAVKFGRPLRWHTGSDSSAAFASIVDSFPDEGLTVVALTNNTGLTHSTATLVVGGKSTTFPATAAREVVEQVESLYFTGKP